MSAFENGLYRISFTVPDGTEETDSFRGTVTVHQIPEGLYGVYDPQELIRRWNDVCPLEKEGEQWVFIAEGFAFATVKRRSVGPCCMVQCGRRSLDSYRNVQAVKIRDNPPPVAGTGRGWWKTVFPSGLGYNQTAILYVEYFSDQMKWVFDSTTSQEVGPMGHYEDDHYCCVRQHHEKEFPDREALLQALMEFVPRSPGSGNNPAGHHSISRYRLTDDLLYSLLDEMFR